MFLNGLLCGILVGIGLPGASSSISSPQFSGTSLAPVTLLRVEVRWQWLAYRRLWLNEACCGSEAAGVTFQLPEEGRRAADAPRRKGQSARTTGTGGSSEPSRSGTGFAGRCKHVLLYLPATGLPLSAGVLVASGRRSLLVSRASRAVIRGSTCPPVSWRCRQCSSSAQWPS